MATVTKNAIKHDVIQSGPYGNAWRNVYTFQTNSSGVMTNSDQTTAVVQTNVVRIGILPAGLQLLTSLHVISDAFSASTTANIGFAYVDGVDDTNVPQDADYFGAAVATSSQARLAAANATVSPVVLPKDAYLILTVGGADHASAGRLDVIVDGVWKGLPSAIPA